MILKLISSKNTIDHKSSISDRTDLNMLKSKKLTSTQKLGEENMISTMKKKMMKIFNAQDLRMFIMELSKRFIKIESMFMEIMENSNWDLESVQDWKLQLETPFQG